MHRRSVFHYLNNSSGSSGVPVIIAVLWIASVIFAGFVGFSLGQNHHTIQSSLGEQTQKQTETTQTLTEDSPIGSQNVIETATATPSPIILNSQACTKSGFAQKWEYLTTYTIKSTDTLQSIAQDQLGDPKRTNEILQINGVGPLVVGATLYLPPPSVSKSSGNLKEIYGKLVSKDATSWRVDFSNDTNGQGILIPTFWFDHIANANTFTIGDCVKVFFDDGDTVYSVSLQ